jgi:hypothetical protein
LGQPTWPATAKAFGAPAPVARTLPFAELVLGALLVAGAGLPWTAYVAFALLVAFTAAVAARLARRDAVPCGCFGESSPAPVGRDTLLRNLVLCWLAWAARRGSGGALAVIGGAALAALFLAESRLRTGAR